MPERMDVAPEQNAEVVMRAKPTKGQQYTKGHKVPSN